MEAEQKLTSRALAKGNREFSVPGVGGQQKQLGIWPPVCWPPPLKPLVESSRDPHTPSPPQKEMHR